MLDQAEAPAREKPRGRGAEIPLLIKLKARNLYLLENLGWDEIGSRCGWDAKSLAQTASREKWTDEKKRRKSLLIEKANARANGLTDQAVEAIASMSEQHAIRGLQKAGEALERNDRDAARDFQSYTAGVKNVVSVARLVRDPSSVSGEGPTNFNLFFMAAPAQVTKESEPKNVTPKAVSTE